MASLLQSYYMKEIALLLSDMGNTMLTQKENPTSRKSILIVDDEINLLRSMAFTLKRNGYKITTATNGKEAFDLIVEFDRNKKSFDLIITDMQLPGLTGKQLIDELNFIKISVPILVITGHGDKNMVVELLNKGCRGYLDKPFNSDELLKQVLKILKQ